MVSTGIKEGPFSFLFYPFPFFPSLSFLSFLFLHSLQHVRKYEDRKAGVDKVIAKVKEIQSVLKDLGMKAELITGGGTGTFRFEGSSGTLPFLFFKNGFLISFLFIPLFHFIFSSFLSSLLLFSSSSFFPLSSPFLFLFPSLSSVLFSPHSPHS